VDSSTGFGTCFTCMAGQDFPVVAGHFVPDALPQLNANGIV
jgi:hypothetical protein